MLILHEGDHGILNEIEDSKKKFTNRENIINYINNLTFPLVLLLLIILSAFAAVNQSLGFNLAIVPAIIGGGYIFISTLRATIETKKITVGILVVIATIATIYIENYQAAAIVVLMMLIGESIESLTLEKTRNAVRELIKLTPSLATVQREGGWVTVSLKEISSNDMVLVKPGEKIPVDGIITSGTAAVNEASITGESMPVDKTKDDKVFAGTIILSGALEICVEKIGDDTTLGQIIRVIKEAQGNKGKTQRVADKFAGYFTPVILLLSLIVYLITGELIRSITILVIACPCALVLATPTAVVASVGNAAKRGALIKGGITLEQAGKVTTVLLDKTGTLTKGIPSVVEIIGFEGNTTNEILAIAASAEEKSEHPIARAILKKAHAEGILLSSAKDFVMTIGRGISATVNGMKIEIGNKHIITHLISPEIESFFNSQNSKGRTVLFVTVDGKVIGALSVADTVRETATHAISALRDLGIKKIIMLTGDNQSTAAAIAKEVGIFDYRAELLPQDKLDIVRELQSQGEVVAMIGDGVNDGPALVLVDVGISMGAAGTDVAIEASDIALMGDELLMVPEVLGLSRKALKIINLNIWGFAVAVNVIGIVLSATGNLTPIQAAIIHNVASAAVVFNSARLLSFISIPEMKVSKKYNYKGIASYKH